MNFLSRGISVETMKASNQIRSYEPVTTKQANLKQAVISSREPNWYVSFTNSFGSL